MKKIILATILLFVAGVSISDNYETTSSGNWSSGSVWSGGSPAPTTGNNDNFFIESGDAVVLNGNLEFSNNCELHVAGDLTINGDLTAWNTLLVDVSGSLTVNGNIIGKNGETITISGSVSVSGDVTAENGGSINLEDGSLSIGGSLTGGDDCEITGNGTINIEGTNDYDHTPGAGVTLNANLPIELLTFNAQCNKKSIDIKWSTATENNTSHYLIEKSTDAIHYTPIADLAAAGNSNEKIDYFYRDFELIEKAYYQLKQIDNDGIYKYYGPIVSGCNNTQSYHIYMDNETDELIAEIYSPYSALNIKVFDLMGIVKYDIDVCKLQIYKLELESLPTGMYIVQFRFDGQDAEVIKIIKKHH